METDEFLAHYGVPGMKWGKRKAQSSDKEAKKPRKPLTSGQKVAIAGAAFVAARLALAAANPEVMNTIKLYGMDAAKKAAGARATRNLLADKRGLTAYATIRMVADSAGNWS